ncbi:hypothetical protein R9C00_17780 [Flammeovirgaceae bacterium SG7u.111]|nr:hypothetical protein [Flammeovirgaceae bacterium SG7u.132]WPO33554.1 hypothetical protein R9C00_17780 [Flammeovirgaceae bacterium SG7u.111]
MTTTIFNQDPIIANTFHNLPEQLKQAFSMEDIHRILNEKVSYYSSLTYSEKCRATKTSMAVEIQKRLRRMGITLTRRQVEFILWAEEDYYLSLGDRYYE